MILGLFIFDYFLWIYKGWAPGLRRGGAEALARSCEGVAKESALCHQPGFLRLASFTTLSQLFRNSFTTFTLVFRNSFATHTCKGPTRVRDLHVYVYIYIYKNTKYIIYRIYKIYKIWIMEIWYRINETWLFWIVWCFRQKNKTNVGIPSNSYTLIKGW